MTPAENESIANAKRLLMGPLADFMSLQQRSAISNFLRGEERLWFADKVFETWQKIQAVPKTYDQSELGDQAVIHLHYFKGGSDWWITERDKDPVDPGEYDQAFGLCAPMGMEMAELGYCSIKEIIEAGVELDLHWTKKTLAEVQK